MGPRLHGGVERGGVAGARGGQHAAGCLHDALWDGRLLHRAGDERLRAACPVRVRPPNRPGFPGLWRDAMNSCVGALGLELSHWAGQLGTHKDLSMVATSARLQVFALSQVVLSR